MKASSLFTALCLTSLYDCDSLLVNAAKSGQGSLVVRKAATLDSSFAAIERSWGRYRLGRSKALHKRQDASTGSTPDTVKLDPSVPKYSPLAPIDGSSITKSIQQTIKNDVDVVLQEFQNLPSYVKDMIKTAFNNVFNGVVYTQTPQEQFNIIQSAITTKLSQIEQNIPTTFYQLLGNQTDDKGNVAALKTCVMQVVAKTTADAQSGASTCLTKSGLSVTSLTDQFNAFVDMNDFQAPVNAQNAVAQKITDFLASSNLAPAQQDLISAANEAVKNVVAAVSAKERDAAQASFQCWVNALDMIAGTSFDQRNIQCNNGALSGSSATKGSPLQSIEEAYTDMVNQYSGVLPPNLVTNIQAIGKTALSLNLGAYDSGVRDAINSAILSNVAATGGGTVKIVYDMIACINTIYDDNPSNDCNPNKNADVLQLNSNIYYNYLDQYVSILPKVLVENLRSAITADLQAKSQVPSAQLQQQLQSLFDTASLGSEYDDCAREFIQCVNYAMVHGTATTGCTGTLGHACGALPPLSPSAPSGGSNPYGDIGNGLRQKARRTTPAMPVARQVQNGARTKRQAYALAVGQKCSWLSTGLNGGVSSDVWTAQLAAALVPHVVA